MSGMAGMWSEVEWDAYHDRIAERESEEASAAEDEFLELAATLGAEHPDALAAHVALLRLFDAEASVDPLLDSSAESLAASCARVLGPHHDLTFEMREFAAVADAFRGNMVRGLARLDALIAERADASGPHDERTFALRIRRARVRTADLKHREEPAPDGAPWAGEWTGLIAEAAHALGADHPLTLEARTWLAYDHCEFGEYLAEEAGYADLARDRARVQGADHEDTLGARERQLSCTVNHGGPAKGTAEFDSAVRELVEDCRRALGVGHPVTQSSMMLLTG